MKWDNLARAATFHFLSVHVLITCCLFNVHVRVMVVWWYQWRGEEETSSAGRGPPIRTMLTSGCTSWIPLISRYCTLHYITVYYCSIPQYITIYYSTSQYITVYDSILCCVHGYILSCQGLSVQLRDHGSRQLVHQIFYDEVLSAILRIVHRLDLSSKSLLTATQDVSTESTLCVPQLFQ